MNRWNNYFIGVAKLTADLSHCVRLKVGAVAVRDRRIISCGYNGMPAGADNCCEDNNYFDVNTQEYITVTKEEVSHAEENLITFSARNGISLLGASLYITHAPCIHCAKLARNAGFKEVIYSQLYRDDSGLKYLEKYEVRTLQWKPS